MLKKTRNCRQILVFSVLVTKRKKIRGKSGGGEIIMPATFSYVHFLEKEKETPEPNMIALVSVDGMGTDGMRQMASRKNNLLLLPCQNILVYKICAKKCENTILCRI